MAQLQDALLVPADLIDQWGVDDQGTQGGLIELCTAASDESKQAADDLQFQTGVRLRELTEPGATGAVYVAQYLLADQPDTVQETFEALQQVPGPATATRWFRRRTTEPTSPTSCPRSATPATASTT